MKTDWMLTKGNYSQSNWIPVRLMEKCTVRRRETPCCNMQHYTDTVAHTHTHKLMFLRLWFLYAEVIWGIFASVVTICLNNMTDTKCLNSVLEYKRGNEEVPHIRPHLTMFDVGAISFPILLSIVSLSSPGHWLDLLIASMVPILPLIVPLWIHRHHSY